ncbi:uncharacterized protein [Parasteatoda tepidariorum]|uniref:uncharacterized protein isoform X4 n=1 Tax=Parasteatoda tepidariorum TaxID=114398 RepID=UPI0039BD56B4
MVLASFPEEYFYHSDPVIMYAAVHDRKHLVDPYTKGIIMKGGYRYTAFVSMKEELRLPYPYGSNCMDYLKEWRKNNGTGPLNELACIEYCKLRKLKFNNECIDEHTWYAPHRETLCNIGQERVTDKIIKECSMECKPACQEQKYEIDYDEVEFESRLCDVGEENCKVLNFSAILEAIWECGWESTLFLFLIFRNPYSYYFTFLSNVRKHSDQE